MVDLNGFDQEELLALARQDIEKERFDEALSKLKQAQRIDANSVTGLNSELGRVYARLGLRDRAREAFEAELKQNPQSVHDRFQLGMVYFEQGDQPGALGIWREVLSQMPLHPPALFYSGLALAQQRELGQAWDLCKLVVDRVNNENLYHGRAKDLLQKIEADPHFKNLPGRPLKAPASTTEH
jgi:tetratricopeptide (TPR) repeat protein